jgi:hypothetical protein
VTDASHGLSYHHLVNVAQWHISDDNYVAARAAIINAHHKHPCDLGRRLDRLLGRPVFPRRGPWRPRSRTRLPGDLVRTGKSPL